MNDSTGPMIELEGIGKRYAAAAAPAVRAVDLRIARGEFCVFVGPSGCGKSTLLRMVAGLESISEGELRIGGRRVNERPAAERGVAMVFQSYALYPHMTVFDNMAFGLQIARLPRTEVERKVNEAARILHLEGLLDRKPKALSGGQRQRVAIGRAIVKNPLAFLFDEPLSNLDAALRAATRVEIARLHRELGSASMIYVTHDQVEAMTLADRIVLLHAGDDIQRHGSVAQVGAPMDLYHRPRSRFVAEFIGSPRINLLPGRLLDAGPARALVAPDGGVAAPLAADVDARPLAAGASVMLGVRPEHLRLAAPEAAAAPGRLAARVAHVERLGECSLLYLDLEIGGQCIARVEGDARERPGQAVGLDLDPRTLHLFGADGRACNRLLTAPE